MPNIKILFLSAVPQGRPQLNVGREFAKIQEGIQSAIPYGNFLELSSVWDVRPDQLTNIFLRHDPDIVHFSGHGLKNGLFLDKNGQSKLVNIDVLKQVFKNVADKTKLVVLNTCHGEDQANAIAEVVGCAIGMPGNIRDSIAMQFSASFYRNIAFGCSIQKAFAISIVDLKLLEVNENTFPKLFIGKTDAGLATLEKRRGYFLLSDNKIWECYVTVLAFSKEIHHMFQVLGVIPLQDLISRFRALAVEPSDINQESFHRSWINYRKESNPLFEIFSSKFPGYEATIPDALTKLKTNKVSNIDDLVEQCRVHFFNIKDNLDKYKEHQFKCAAYMDPILISDIKANKEIGASIQNLKQFSDSLTVAADDFLRKLIKILLDE